MKVQNEFYDVMTLKDVYAHYEKRGIDIILGNGDVDVQAMEKELERKKSPCSGNCVMGSMNQEL